MALQLTTLLLLQRCCCCGVVAAALLLMRCACCNVAVGARYGVAAATVLWRCGAAVEIFCFFLLDNFRRENECEKEKKERDSKLVSRLYWLA